MSNISNRAFVRRSILGKKLYADALDSMDLSRILNKLGARSIGGSPDPEAMAATAYIPGVDGKVLIKKAINAVESYRGSTFSLDSNVAVKHINNDDYAFSFYVASLTCIDQDARIFITVVDDYVGCTVSLVQSTNLMV